MARQHLTRTYATPEANEERCVALLSECGTTGIEVRGWSGSGEPSGMLRLIAYFETVPEAHEELPKLLGETVGGIRWVAEEWVEDRDWQAEFRRRAQPIPVGDRFLIDPGEFDREAPPSAGRFLLRLPARTAFGTGSHETTQLTLEWMEQIAVHGQAVLDVGSGSGILSLAAQRLGARSVVGFDCDLPSALMSGQYERLNRPVAASDSGGVAFFAGTIAGLRLAGQFDLLLINVLPHRVAADLPLCSQALRRDGHIVVSGLLESEAEAVLESWAALGWRPVSQRQRGEWVAWLLADGRSGSQAGAGSAPTTSEVEG